MAEATLLKKTEDFVAKAQDDILDASRHLAESVTKEATRLTPPIAEDVMNVVGEVFDFAQRVTEAQRTMVNQVLTSALKSTGTQGTHTTHK